MAKVPEYVGQVIIEKAFTTKADAERWMREQDDLFTREAKVDSIETHLWEPASPIGAKKVNG